MRIKIFVICFVLIGLVLTGCSIGNTPPDIESVQSVYDKNCNNMNVVLNYMVNIGYENIYILNSDGKMLSDLQILYVEDSAVLAAIKTLLESGDFIEIYKRGNTISFQCWKGIQDIGCGIAYTIQNIGTPEIQFMTASIPLSEAGWYYYIYDYNSWRNSE